MAAGRNLFPWIWLHKGAMNSSKLATPICLISCIRTVAVLCFFFFRHSQAICYIYIILMEADKVPRRVLVLSNRK